MKAESSQLGTFHLSCWVLGLIAFIELVAVGVALGLQKQETTSPAEPVVVEKIVREYIALPPEPKQLQPEVAISEPKKMKDLPPRPPIFTPREVEVRLTTPPIADPIAEKYVEDARTLRVQGDNGGAYLKLVEAEKRAPDNANVFYEYALIHENMGIYDKAEDYYQQVFEKGMVEAGSLYELAAMKLRDGFDKSEDMTGKFALGRVRVFRDKRWQEGERVILNIPVSAAPNINLSEGDLLRALEIKVNLYDKEDGQAVLRDDFASSVHYEWVTKPVDWLDGGEEILSVVYEIPKLTSGEDHLLGQRAYYGQVVELEYEGQLLDRLASPRHLAGQSQARGDENYYYPDNYVPDDFNFDNPLLPPLPE